MCGAYLRARTAGNKGPGHNIPGHFHPLRTRYSPATLAVRLAAPLQGSQAGPNKDLTQLERSTIV